MKKYCVLMVVLALAITIVAGQTYGTVRKHGQEMTWLGTSNVESYSGLSTDTKPTTWRGTAVTRGASFFETDTRRTWVYDGSAWQPKTMIAVQDTTQLSAPANFPAIGVNGYSTAEFVVKVIAVNTSVTIRFMGLVNNGLGWFPLDADNDSLIITSNTTVGRTFAYVGVLDSLRTTWHSEAGGTAAKVTSGIKLGNPYK